MTARGLQKPGARGKLTDEAKTFVVQQLAIYEPAASVRRALKDAYGIDLSDNGVRAYDASSAKGADLAERWKVLFRETREAFLKDVAAIGISHRVVRLRAIDRMASRAEAQGNIALAASLLEQAAKEMGDAYTNTRVLRGGLELTTPKTLSDFYAGMSAQDEAGAYAGTPQTDRLQ